MGVPALDFPSSYGSTDVLLLPDAFSGGLLSP
jgi:hypothetical protein